MAAGGDIVITHFQSTMDRAHATTPLAEMEPFVRALAAWRGGEDAVWEDFQQAAHRLADNDGQSAIDDTEGIAFLTWTLDEANVSNYLLHGDGYETPALGGEAYSKVQRVLRRLQIPRLDGYETKIFNQVLNALKQRLVEQGYNCYGIESNDIIQYVLIIKSPAEFEDAARSAGIDLITSWDDDAA